MEKRKLNVRLNPAVPRERALLVRLAALPARQWATELKRLAHQALTRAASPAAGETASPSPPRAAQRAAFQPPAAPKPRHAAELLGLLTPGEAEVLETLAWHPYLSAADVAQWQVCSLSFARAALGFLEQKGAVAALLKTVAPWPRANYYTLTDFGVLLLAEQEQVSLATMKHRLGVGAHQWGFLEHTVEANRFFLALHAPSDTGRLAEWRSEGASRVTFPYAGWRKRGVLRPDGYGEWVDAHWRYAFYLEWDRHTGNPQKLREKLRLYLDYLSHLQQNPAESVVVPRLLFVANDANRSKTILALLPEVAQYHPYTVLPLLLTDRERVWQHGPLADIWLRPSGGPRVGPWEEGLDP